MGTILIALGLIVLGAVITTLAYGAGVAAGYAEGVACVVEIEVEKMTDGEG